jgi:hypothetical protein
MDVTSCWRLDETDDCIEVIAEVWARPGEEQMHAAFVRALQNPTTRLPEAFREQQETCPYKFSAQFNGDCCVGGVL